MWGYPPVAPSPAPTRGPVESDDALRTRLLYVAGGPREPHHHARIQQADTAELNRLAEEFGLERRGQNK